MNKFRILQLFLPLFLCLSPFAGAQDQTMYDSTRDGRYQEFNDSGKLLFEGRYRDSLRQGVFKEYDPQGFLSRKIRYRKGKPVWIKVYRNGRLAEIINRKGKVRKKKDCGC